LPRPTPQQSVRSSSGWMLHPMAFPDTNK
jgi:hypothetical protein